MHILKFMLTVAVVIGSSSVATAQPPADQTPPLVLAGGTLIDGKGGQPIRDSIIVIQGERIVAVGTRTEVQIPPNSHVVSTAGKTVLPGLIDSHMHMRDYMVPLFLHFGVTTIADINNYTDWTIAQREALKTGKIKGPRLFVSGTAVGGVLGNDRSQLPGQPRRPFGAYSRTSSSGADSPAVAVETPEEARAYVRSLLTKRVDVIKVDLDLTLDQLRAVLEEAAKGGVAVVGHSLNIRKAAEVGLRYAEHTDTIARSVLEEERGREGLDEAARLEQAGDLPERLMDASAFDSLVSLLVQKHVFVNPTLFARWRESSPRDAQWKKVAAEFIKDPGLAFVPPAIRQSWVHPSKHGPDPVGFAKVTDFLRRFENAGGKIIPGTDAGGNGTIPGLSLHYEMQMLVDLGVSPMRAIQGATLWGAEFIGQQRDLGSVEVGKLADIVVIDGDPLSDISTTQNVQLVIEGGKIEDTDFDPAFRNPIPRPLSSS